MYILLRYASFKAILLASLAFTIVVSALFHKRDTSYFFIETRQPADSIEIQFRDIPVKLSKTAFLQLKHKNAAGYFFYVDGRVPLDIKFKNEITPEKPISLYWVKTNYFFTEIREWTLNQSSYENYNPLNIQTINTSNFNPYKAPIQNFQRNYLFLILFFFSFVSLYAFKGWLLMLQNSSLVFKLALSSMSLLLIAMALISHPNIGPDEYMHMGSTSWYLSKWAPPSLGEENYYINHYWKTNYLFGVSGDFTYWVTAKSSQLLSTFFELKEQYISFRLAQLFIVFLIFGFLSLLCGTLYAQIFFVMFCIIPQLGFINTYLNGDALSVALSFLSLSLVLSAKKEEKLFFFKTTLSLFLLFSVKRNMLVLCPVLLFFLLEKYNFKWHKDWLKQIAIWVLASPLIFYRRIFNFFDQKEFGKTYFQAIVDRIQAAPTDDSLVQVAYNSILMRSHPPSEWKWEILVDKYWYIFSFDSFFAIFGHMNIHFPRVVIYTSLLGFLSFIFIGVKKQNYKTSLLFLFLLVGTVMASLYYSLANGYQPQGRYLYGILVGAAIMFAKPNEKYIDRFCLFLPLPLFCFLYFVGTDFFSKGLNLTH